MNKQISPRLTTVIAVLVLMSGCSAGQTAVNSTNPQVTATTPPATTSLTTSSADWKLEIKGASWGGNSTLPLEPGQKQLLVFTNLEYIGKEADVEVPPYGVKGDQGRDFIVFSSFGYGSDVPAGGEDWIASFVSGKPATRHFTPGEAFRPLMFTFAGPEAEKTFIFFFGDLSLDFTSLVKESQ